MNGAFSTGTDPLAVILSSFCFSPELAIRTLAYDIPCFGREAGSRVIGGDVSLSLNECGGFMVVGVCCGVSRLISLSSWLLSGDNSS